MFDKNKKIKIIAIIEAVLIIALAVPLVFFSNTGKKTDSTVPAIKNESDIIKEESVYQPGIPQEEYTPPPVVTDISSDISFSAPDTTTTTSTADNSQGYTFYKDRDINSAIPGIDVSEFQGYIDWKQVKESGIEFAFIRVGCRTYDDGGIIYDKRFKENLYSADRAGIKTGVYFFSQAVTIEEAIEEADAVIKAIEPFNITYPVVFDWEIIYEDYARTDEITIDSLSDCCIAFCDRVKEAGYTPMIYQNTSTLLSNVDLPKIKPYDIWLAEYNDRPTYYYDYEIWQYTSEGNVPGISTIVDMNVSFKDYSRP